VCLLGSLVLCTVRHARTDRDVDGSIESDHDGFYPGASADPDMQHLPENPIAHSYINLQSIGSTANREAAHELATPPFSVTTGKNVCCTAKVGADPFQLFYSLL